jgi:hypothetical protein
MRAAVVHAEPAAPAPPAPPPPCRPGGAAACARGSTRLGVPHAQRMAAHRLSLFDEPVGPHVLYPHVSMTTAFRPESGEYDWVSRCPSSVMTSMRPRPTLGAYPMPEALRSRAVAAPPDFGRPGRVDRALLDMTTCCFLTPTAAPELPASSRRACRRRCRTPPRGPRSRQAAIGQIPPVLRSTPTTRCSDTGPAPRPSSGPSAVAAGCSGPGHAGKGTSSLSSAAASATMRRPHPRLRYRLHPAQVGAPAVSSRSSNGSGRRDAALAQSRPTVRPPLGQEAAGGVAMSEKRPRPGRAIVAAGAQRRTWRIGRHG